MLDLIIDQVHNRSISSIQYILLICRMYCTNNAATTILVNPKHIPNKLLCQCKSMLPMKVFMAMTIFYKELWDNFDCIQTNSAIKRVN